MKKIFCFLIIIMNSCTDEIINIYEYEFINEKPVNTGVYMYGTTNKGGAYDLGTIYRVDENGQNLENVFDFTTATGGNPFAGLTLANDGKLYGFTTAEGQLVNTGAIFKLGSFFEFDPLTKALVVIAYIDDKSDIGNTFNQAPTLSSEGLLYAVSQQGNWDGSDPGKIWSYNTSNGTITILDTFTSHFGDCKSQLLEASDNNFYVLTNNGGAGGQGAVVRYNKLTAKLERIQSTIYPNEYNGAANNPLFEASDGYLYGASLRGGAYNQGFLFKMLKDGTAYTELKNFENTLSGEGFWPQGGFVEKDGFLYSSASQEENIGTHQGAFYKIGVYTTSSFSWTNILDLEGAQPLGTFQISTNGRFYITCNNGGNSGTSGTIVEYNPINGNITKRSTFNSSDGINPKHNKLCLVNLTL